MKRATGAATLALAWLVAAPAWAEPSAADRAAATSLFKEGKRLMAEGQLPQACARFAESQRLDPSGGTVLNLALCHEQEGRLASAWSEFNEALSVARRDGRADREAAATEHIAAIEPRLSKLTVQVPPAARAPGMTIRRDGTDLGEASWSEAMPVDGGDHEVEVTATGKVPAVLHVHVGPERDQQVVVVPALANARAVRRAAPDAGPQRALGFIVGGAGILEVAAGAFFAARAFDLHGQSDDACPRGRCSVDAVSLEGDATRAANTATVLVGVGLTSVALGVALLLTAPKQRSLALQPGARSVGGRF